VTARAAILVVAVASVMVAIALPLKIWLGQRGDIASLAAQTRQAEVTLQHLNAQDKRWQNPGYVESQARKRLHYTLPGQTSRVRLGPAKGAAQAAANRPDPATTGPWYAQFWQSLEMAGGETTSATTGSVTSTR
jgi:crotonobetainyl-CoA:carnitine CoA-transferase CaiB-like acyl-CoA transferase